MSKQLQELINKYMPKRYYGHEARKYAKLIAEEYADLMAENSQSGKYEKIDKKK